jgi:hypothetical protein
VAVYKRGRVWWYKFTWKGEAIRESTKHTNKRVAEQIEAAHKTSLAKGEVGIRDRIKVPTLKAFIEQNFRPFTESRCQSKPKTLEYYKSGLKHLASYPRLANTALDAITVQDVGAFVATRRNAGFQVSSINRQLEVLRRIFKVAAEWGAVDKILPKVEMLRGERHRDRVLTSDEENRYLDAAATVGFEIEQAYLRALRAFGQSFVGNSRSNPKTRSDFAT